VTGSNHPDQGKEDAGSDECGDKAHDETASCNAQERGEDPAPQERAEDPDDNVPQHAESMAAHDSSRQRARYQSNDDEEKKMHGSSCVSPTITPELMLGVACEVRTGPDRGWLPDYEQLDQHRRAYRHGELCPLPHGDASSVRISCSG
jgi:hypothetical protein